MKLTTLGILLVTIGILLTAVWTVASFYVIWRVEEAGYKTVDSTASYEVRRYEPMLVAETELDAQAEEPTTRAFKTLAAYIFGKNEKRRDIGMTAPVITDGKRARETIGMTAPVLVDQDAGPGRMAFVMPSRFTLETLPRPVADNISIREVPERLVAAISFSWYATTSRREQKARELLSMLERDGLTPKSAPVYAGYNPPFSVPFLMRHEILVEVEARS